MKSFCPQGELGKKVHVKKVQGREINVSRLLLATCTEQVKVQVMRRAYKLKSSDPDVMQRIWLKHDMSKDDRKREFEVRREAKLK